MNATESTYQGCLQPLQGSRKARHGKRGSGASAARGRGLSTGSADELEVGGIWRPLPPCNETRRSTREKRWASAKPDVAEGNPLSGMHLIVRLESAKANSETGCKGSRTMKTSRVRHYHVLAARLTTRPMDACRKGRRAQAETEARLSRFMGCLLRFLARLGNLGQAGDASRGLAGGM